jgi:ABC-type sulfate/molybdate transport systems ATPase subunit
VIGTLSAGQRKRVAFADAVLLRPRVLLLDDFFSELDIEMREAAPEVFSAVAAFSSVVITGHELDDLARCSTRFLVLRDGTVSSSLPAAGLAPAELRAKVCAMLKGGRR